jgi:hypothetical protein
VVSLLEHIAEGCGVRKVSKTINTSFVERHNGTDRNRNARKVRKTYRFSKDWQVHQAVTYFTIYTYNFCQLLLACTNAARAGTGQPVARANTGHGRRIDRSP